MGTVKLQGQISRIFEGNRTSIITLYVKNRRANLPQIVFTGRGRELLDGFKQGDYVSVSGVIKTRGERQDDGRILHTQFIKCEDISIVDEPEDGSAFPYINEAIVDGTIVKSTVGNKMITLLVRPDGEKFNIWVFKYCEDPDAEIENFEVNSSISAQCEIQTSRKEINGEVKFFENVVIRDVNTR